MNTERRCPQCGQMAAGSSQGLCPGCLLIAGLAGERTGPEVAGRTAKQGEFALPSGDELQRHLPQLEILSLIGRGGMGAVYLAPPG